MTFAHCIPTRHAVCTWATSGPDARAVDKAAEKHTKATQHPTSVRGWA